MAPKPIFYLEGTHKRKKPDSFLKPLRERPGNSQVSEKNIAPVGKQNIFSRNHLKNLYARVR